MRTVRVIVYAQAALLDIAAALCVFNAGNVEAARRRLTAAYDARLVSIVGGPVPTDAGVSIPTSRARVEALDTLLLPSGGEAAVEEALCTTRIGKYLREQVRSAERIGAMGAGVLLLARAGLINGKRVSAAASDNLHEFPTLHRIRDKPYVVDGRLWTSGGALSGCQLALAMVGHDLGREMAEAVAQSLNLPPADTAPTITRPSPPAEQSDPETERFQMLQRWIAENPKDDLSTVALAARSGVSVRSLHRRFMTQTGDTPAKFVEAARVRAAQHMLDSTRMTLQSIATACGFSSAAVMHNAFKRQTGMRATRYGNG